MPERLGSWPRERCRSSRPRRACAGGPAPWCLMSIPPGRLIIASIENLLGSHVFQALLTAGFGTAGFFSKERVSSPNQSPRTRGPRHPSRPRCGSGSATSAAFRAWYATGHGRAASPVRGEPPVVRRRAHPHQQGRLGVGEVELVITAQQRDQHAQHRCETLPRRCPQHHPALLLTPTENRATSAGEF